MLSANSLPVSVTAASNSDLIAALAPVSDDAESQPEIVGRLNAILNIGFQQDMNADERKALLAEYWRAVSDHPAWAIHRAIDAAQRATPNRRPTPGEIGIHCDRQVERVRAELRHRRAKADAAVKECNEARDTAKQTQRIRRALGY